MTTRSDFLKNGSLTVAGTGSLLAATSVQSFTSNRPSLENRNFVSDAVRQPLKTQRQN